MRALRLVGSVLACLVLVMAYVGLGFLACVAPPVTHAMARSLSNDQVSPFNREQLALVADATRNYAFGNHDELELYQAIYTSNRQLADSASGPDAVPQAYLMQQVSDPQDLDQLRAAAFGVSEAYCYSKDSIAHLDDCYALARVAYPLVWASIISSAAIVFVAMARRYARWLSGVLCGAGIVVLVAFGAAGIWAVVDFQGLFTTFHTVFFSQGNWQFPYNSLMICELPTEFWCAMGGVWLTVTLLCSIASILVGRHLSKTA